VSNERDKLPPRTLTRAAAYRAYRLIKPSSLNPIRRIEAGIERVSNYRYPTPARERQAAKLIFDFSIRARLLLDVWEIAAALDELRAFERRAVMLRFSIIATATTEVESGAERSAAKIEADAKTNLIGGNQRVQRKQSRY